MVSQAERNNIRAHQKKIRKDKLDLEKQVDKLARQAALKACRAAAAAPCDETDPFVATLIKEARQLKKLNEILRQKQLTERRVPPSVRKR